MNRLKRIISLTAYLLFFLLSTLNMKGITNEQHSVVGMVVDLSGYPIHGAIVSSGENVYKTDEKGAFSIQTKESISISMEGYRTQFFHPPFETLLIKLEKDPIHQPINIAYTKQNKLGLTSAVSNITGEQLEDSYVTNIGNTLFGKLSGLTVNPVGGEPGKDHPTYNIRGITTLNNAAPLIYVDGFEMTMDLLMPEEIESISILKDAAALAPFGIKGANGVIWVTTKRGKIADPKLKVSLKTGLQEPTKLPKFVDAYNYASLYNEANSNDNYNIWSPYYSNEQLNAYKTGNDGTIANYDLLYPNVNWYDEVLKSSAPTTNADVSFSGGNKSVRYFLLLGYQHTEGLYKDTDKKRGINSNLDYKRFNLRANVDAQLTNIFDVSVQFGGAIEDQYTPGATTSSLWNNMAKYPANAFPVKTPKGWGGTALHPDNPKATVIQKGFRQFHYRSLQASLTLGQNLEFITPGLRLTETYSLQNYTGSYYYKYRDFQRFQPYAVSDTEVGYYVTGSQDNDFTISQTGTSRNTQNVRQNIQLALTYDRRFNLHQFHGSVIFHTDEYLIDGDNVPFVTRGFMGRLGYGYNSKYFTELGYAINGTGDFPKGNNIGFFPSLSVAWLASNEDFLKNSRTIDLLKLRASIGILGNSDIGGQRFAYQQYYHNKNSSTKFGWEGTASAALLYEYTMANRDLTWEKALKANIGIDARLLKKLDVELDLFYERRYDILVSQNEFEYLGILTGMSNEGEVTNKGMELSLMWQDKIGKVSYYAQSTFSFARNKIEKMNEVPRAEEYLKRTGKSISQPFALEAMGLFQSWEEINDPSTPKHTFEEVQPGDIRYVDQNGDGFIDDNDLVALKDRYSSLPEITYGINVGANYGDFDLKLTGYGVANRSVYLNGINNWAFQNSGNVSEWALDRWAYYPDQGIDTRSTASYPRLSLGTNSNNWRNSSFWSKNGGYFRLSEVILGYTIPRSITTKIKIDKLRVFILASNLLTIDDIDMVDPAVMTGHSFLKSFNIGLNLNF